MGAGVRSRLECNVPVAISIQLTDVVVGTTMVELCRDSICEWLVAIRGF